MKETITLESMSRNEKGLLLYLETVCVDYQSRLEPVRMNDEDFKILCAWRDAGFIDYGRIKSEFIKSSRSYWVSLSEEAWALVHKERRERAVRTAHDPKIHTSYKGD